MAFSLPIWVQTQPLLFTCFMFVGLNLSQFFFTPSFKQDNYEDYTRCLQRIEHSACSLVALKKKLIKDN